jgi:hypothetical protein
MPVAAIADGPFLDVEADIDFGSIECRIRVKPLSQRSDVTAAKPLI